MKLLILIAISILLVVTQVAASGGTGCIAGVRQQVGMRTNWILDDVWQPITNSTCWGVCPSDVIREQAGWQPVNDTMCLGICEKPPLDTGKAKAMLALIGLMIG